MMSIPAGVADIPRNPVLLEVESIDRRYLNVYVPQPQRELGVVSFFRYHRPCPAPSSALRGPMTHRLAAAIQPFVQQQGIPLVAFAKGQRKDDVARHPLAGFQQDEGVLFVGKAQEIARVFRTQKRHDPQTGPAYPWMARSTARVNAYYVYGLDRDFGPFFLKFCSYFPYNAKRCIHGHEYLKRQLPQRGIAHQALDNGVLWCEDPQRLQAIADPLSAGKIDRRRWPEGLRPVSAR